MKIHIYCRQIAPAVGGMERLFETLAREFVALGHSVHVVTETQEHADLPFVVYRRPGFFEDLKLARSSDVILSAPLSLKRLPAQLLSGRKIFVSHPDKLGGVGRHAVFSFFKRRISRYLVNIVPSKFMAKFFYDAHIILNPYDDSAFFPPTENTPRKNVLFVGRLDRLKGVHLLIEAFSQIVSEIRDQNLTIVGGGAQYEKLIDQATELGIADRVRFAGFVRGPALTSLMQSHAVMVVPSIMEEPFGIVALEGLACGCRMVVSKTGGLPEAVGPFAKMFESGDVAGLADCLRTELQRDKTEEEDENVRNYLGNFSPKATAKQFLSLLGQQIS